MKGIFVMVDGLEGSGKGTVLEAFSSLFEHVFDLRAHMKEHRTFPALEDVKPEVVLSVEPTYSTVGVAIRNELLRSDYKYAAMTTAHTFALDREILYNRCILPLLKAGKMVIQERGIVSSLVYQPVQLEKLSLRDIMNIQGNRIAIQNAPNFLIIVKSDPEKVESRTQGRPFDSLFFHRKIEERFEAEWLKSLFERFGTQVLYLDGNCSLSELRERSIELFKSYILGGQKTLLQS